MADKITTMYTEEQVNSRIKELGEEISRDYAGKELTMICILKGAAAFACELAKRIDLPVDMEYMEWVSISVAVSWCDTGSRC